MGSNKINIDISTNRLGSFIDGVQDLTSKGFKAHAALDDACRRPPSGAAPWSTSRDRVGPASPTAAATGRLLDPGRSATPVGAAFEMAKGGEHAACIDTLAALGHTDFENAMSRALTDCLAAHHSP